MGSNFIDHQNKCFVKFGNTMAMIWMKKRNLIDDDWTKNHTTTCIQLVRGGRVSYINISFTLWMCHIFVKIWQMVRHKLGGLCRKYIYVFVFVIPHIHNLLWNFYNLGIIKQLLFNEKMCRSRFINYNYFVSFLIFSFLTSN